ncbi:2,3,4,5-tetrahydropyridine-2,6-dicarboxylate N-succinyltransferase [Candidatus Saccharibacteria bacterium]|jgi:2,3,4,5-tetrahydropyridine-2-carboxylate N-succinyltransferase|nr:2,3,4,5-tetrahydropyridine-2,6-dicarboxylate N-succinyltransferase [Candidatus Saccharibacteria bacterium]MBP9132147.1 2,3,4,5-tetrahydropyridine-2,6-dicarboxylate N-succinyltransferase [Candidatus Saccharibacteria bacterium]
MQTEIEKLSSRLESGELSKSDVQAGRKLVEQLLDSLESGQIRVVEPTNGSWKLNSWVKKGILAGFKLSETVKLTDGTQFIDKDLYGLRDISVEQGARLTPPASGVRRGAFIGKGAVLMSPAYVNVGAYVGENTMIESLAGSCAQIGSNCHISFGTVIGGVLDPVEAAPVIIGNNVLMGESSGVTQGTRLEDLVTLAPGVHISMATPVIDPINQVAYTTAGTVELVTEKLGDVSIYSVGKLIEAKDKGFGPQVPKGALVIPGLAKSSQGGLKMAPTIAKYISSSDERAYALEDALR